MLSTTIFSLAILSGISLAFPLDDHNSPASPLLTTRAKKCEKKNGEKAKDKIKLYFGTSSSIGDLEIAYYKSDFFRDNWDTDTFYYGPCYSIRNKGDCEVTLSFSKDAKFSQDEGDTRSGVLPPDRTEFACYSYTTDYSSYISAFGEKDIYLRTQIIGEEEEDSLSESKAQSDGTKQLILVDKKSDLPGKCPSKKKPKKCDKNKRSVLEEAWE